MLGSVAARRFVSVLAVVGVVVAATACDPPPEPSDDIEVTYLDIPGERNRWNPRVMVNSREEVVVSARFFRSYPVAYRWEGGQSLRLSEGDTRARALSERGHIVGDFRDAEGAPSRPFLWFEGELTELPLGDAMGGEATAVNDHGVVAGVTYSESSITPAVWREGELLTPPADVPFGDTVVLGISNRNEVLMFVLESGGAAHTVLWEVGGDVTHLGEMGYQYGGSFTYDIYTGRGDRRMNGRGMALVPHGGPSQEEDMRTSVWHNGEITDLGTLGGDVTYATAINEWGQVVGVSTDEEGTYRPFLWYEGEMTQLESFGDEGWAQPVAINNWGQVVGFAGIGTEVEPFLWQNGKAVNLGGLVQNVERWALGSGIGNFVDITDRGQIVGNAYDADFGDFSVMWEVSPTWGYYPDGLP